MYIFCTIFSGAFILGLIGDKFGRKLALILAVLLAGGSGCLQAFVGDRTLFALLRITVGMGGMGMFMIPAIFAGTFSSVSYIPLHWEKRGHSNFT